MHIIAPDEKVVCGLYMALSMCDHNKVQKKESLIMLMLNYDNRIWPEVQYSEQHQAHLSN